MHAAVFLPDEDVSQTLLAICSTRFRGVSAYPCLNDEVHICELKTCFWISSNNSPLLILATRPAILGIPGFLSAKTQTLQNKKTRQNLEIKTYKTNQTNNFDPGFPHSSFSHRNFLLLSIIIWPSGPNSILSRSNGLGAGPSKCIPSLVKPLP